MVISVGDGPRQCGAGRLGGLVRDPIATLERIRVCKRDGVLLAEPRASSRADDAGLGIWQKLMVYAGEQARHDGHPLLHAAGAAAARGRRGGATALRGIWGFSGDHPPHGDRLFQLRRQVPVVTVGRRHAGRIHRWFA